MIPVRVYSLIKCWHCIWTNCNSSAGFEQTQNTGIKIWSADKGYDNPEPDQRFSEPIYAYLDEAGLDRNNEEPVGVFTNREDDHILQYLIGIYSQCCRSASLQCGSGSSFLYYNAEPDPAFHLNADPDPAPIKNWGISGFHWTTIIKNSGQIFDSARFCLSSILDSVLFQTNPSFFDNLGFYPINPVQDKKILHHPCSGSGSNQITLVNFRKREDRVMETLTF